MSEFIPGIRVRLKDNPQRVGIVGQETEGSGRRQDDALLSVTAGILISRAKALYAAGSVGGSQRKQENFK